MSQNYTPKSAINLEEHGNPFDVMQEGIDFFMNLAQSKGYQAQINAISSISGTTRYAVNQVIQHTDINNIMFSLKLLKDKKQSAATSTLLGKKGYQNLFDTVESNLLKSPDIPFLQGLPSPKNGNSVDLTGVEWSMEDRAETIVEAVGAAEEVTADFRLAGTATSALTYYRVVSTEDIDVETSSSSNYFKVNAITGPPDGRGYGMEDIVWRYDRPDVFSMASEATQTALDSVEAKLITKDAGDYEVLFGSRAFNDILEYVRSFTAVEFHESNSYTSDRLGDQIFDEKLTVYDTPRDPKLTNVVRSFDAEGIVTENQKLFDNGVLKFIPYDSFTASKYLEDKDMTTGHQLGAEFGTFYAGTAQPVSLSVKTGNKTLEEQIADVDDGLFIKNFWYTRFTQRREGGLTGLTRNGMYAIKNGEIEGAVRNLRYTDSFLSAFGPGNIVSMSKDRKMFGMTNVPSVHLNKFHFSSVAHTSQALE